MTNTGPERWNFGGRWYTTILASDVLTRDGRAWNLTTLPPAPGRGTVSLRTSAILCLPSDLEQSVDHCPSGPHVHPKSEPEKGDACNANLLVRTFASVRYA